MDNQETRIHASVGEQLIKKYEDKLHEGDAIVVQLFKVYDAFGDYLTTTHPYKIGFFPTTLLENLMSFQVKFPKSILRTTMIFLVESLITTVWLVSQFLCHLSCSFDLY